MRYYGSAMRTPHVQGAFRQEIVVEPHQAHVLADSLSDGEGCDGRAAVGRAACGAARGPAAGQARAGDGLRADRRAGRSSPRGAPARRTSWPPTSAHSARQGAQGRRRRGDQRRRDARRRCSRFTADKGSFDVLFEASGNAARLRGAFDALRPRGIIVQVGLGGEMPLPINTIVAKEFDLRGAFRFHEEFAVAVELLNKGLVDVKPLISATFPYRDSARAFAPPAIARRR